MVRPDDATIVLDAGTVIRLARGDARLRAALRKAHHLGTDVAVPMIVISETVRGNGPHDAAVNLVLARFGPHRPLDEDTARLAGALLGASKSNHTADALVAAEALRRSPSTLITSDPTDMRLLLTGHPGVSIEAI